MLACTVYLYGPDLKFITKISKKDYFVPIIYAIGCTYAIQLRVKMRFLSTLTGITLR